MTKCDNNFPKRIFFGKLHYGLSSGKKLSQGKNCLYARISFNKKVTAVTKKMQGERANILKAILGYMANGEQGDELLLALLIKSYPREMAKKSIEGAGFSLLRNMEVHEAIQFRFILHLPMNTYKRIQRIMTNFRYDKHFFPSHYCITLEQQKIIPKSLRTPF